MAADRTGAKRNRSAAEMAPLPATKSLGNARATGGPGILPETNYDSGFPG